MGGVPGWGRDQPRIQIVPAGLGLGLGLGVGVGVGVGLGLGFYGYGSGSGSGSGVAIRARVRKQVVQKAQMPGPRIQVLMEPHSNPNPKA